MFDPRPLAIPPPAGIPPQVALWRLDLRLDTPLGTATLAALSADERARYRQYRRQRDRVRFGATRAALRGLLALRLGLAPQAIRFFIGRYGKPQLAAGASFFNVSHAGDYALIALADTVPVGVDLERIDATRPLADLATQLFSPDECASCANDAAAFYALWSGKEAVLKAWGCGIAEHLPALSLRPGRAAPDDPEFALSFRGQPETATRAWRIAAPDGYAAALALGGSALGEHLPRQGCSHAGRTMEWSSAQRGAAIDAQVMHRDVARALGSEVAHRLGDVARAGDASQWDAEPVAVERAADHRPRAVRAGP